MCVAIAFESKYTVLECMVAPSPHSHFIIAATIFIINASITIIILIAYSFVQPYANNPTGAYPMANRLVSVA